MNKILLLSYPRSGNSLVKYFIKRSIKTDKVHDCVFQSATRKKIKLSNEWFNYQEKIGNRLFKEHSANNCYMFNDNLDSLILIVRNYKECILRHKPASNSSQAIRKTQCNIYKENIVFFDKWRGNKVILYYEDLIVDFKTHYTKILDVIDVDINEHNKLFSNIEYHKKLCLNQYDKVCGSQTKGKELIFHSKKIPQNVVIEMNKFFNNNKITRKYLQRYI